MDVTDHKCNVVGERKTSCFLKGKTSKLLAIRLLYLITFKVCYIGLHCSKEKFSLTMHSLVLENTRLK